MKILQYLSYSLLVFYILFLLVYFVSIFENIEVASNIFTYPFFITMMAVIASVVLYFLSEKRKKLFLNLLFVVPMISIFIFVYEIVTMELRNWGDGNIEYRHKKNPNVTINYQVYDKGGMGGCDSRVVKITPILNVWNFIEEVDTTKINSEKWRKVAIDVVNFP